MILNQTTMPCAYLSLNQTLMILSTQTTMILNQTTNWFCVCFAEQPGMIRNLRWFAISLRRRSAKAVRHLQIFCEAGCGPPDRFQNNRREQLFNRACWGLADLLDPDVRIPGKLSSQSPRGRSLQHDRNEPIVREVWQLYTKPPVFPRGGCRPGGRETELSESAVRKLWYGKPGMIYRKFIAMDLPL